MKINNPDLWAEGILTAPIFDTFNNVLNDSLPAREGWLSYRIIRLV